MAEIFNFYVQDNRTILFPKKNLLEPIMQEDKDVATWRFRIPKVLNQIDMSAWSWWFVYVNAKGQKYSELLTLTDDIDEPSSYSTADYDIDYGISKFPGSFSFALEAISTEQGGEIDGEWHTKTYKHKVDSTLQGNQAEYAETEHDIISALITEYQNLHVGTNQITDGAVTFAKLANDAVTSVKIADGAVTNGKLASNSVSTANVQDGAITEAKLNARLKLLTNVDLNGVTYFENIALPVVQSYAEAVTYLNGYYYVACRDYSATPNTCYVAKYDSSFVLVNTVYTSVTYGIANNIFNDGNRIYIDYDNGYHVSFNASVSDDFAVQNTNIRNMAYWDNTLYGVAINANNVTVYTVASDFVTAEEVFSVITQRYTLQSASIIDGILYIPTTKGLFKFIDMQTQRVIAEIPYYDSKEIENFFKDKDGTVKCSGHFYGLNGVFNIGTFDGGVNGAKMQYTDIDGNAGDYRLLVGERYGFYKISNGTAMGLPDNTGDLLLFDQAKFFVSNVSNKVYVHKNNVWSLFSFLTGKSLYKKVDSSYIFFELTNDGHFVVRSDLFYLTSSAIAIDIDLSDIYTALGLNDAKTFTRYVLGTSKTMNIAYSTNDAYGAQIYVSKARTQIFTRNITQNTTQNIDARIEFYVTLI